MKHKALVRRLQISCLGLDPIDPLRLLVDDVIEALREHAMREVQRLGQEIEQEPVCPDCKAKVLYECVACSSNNYPPKTEQEPVAVVDANDEGYWADILPDRNVKVGQLLYTAPSQRTFVGLTSDDWKQITRKANYHWEMTTSEYAERIGELTEAKLKEKNT